ncbi:hypothetical protein HDU97_001577 [Phlyctochytrium planicorne]|nr:hypothetical protein HDU97_001577 [Phlyctochytrium planicorne]
MDQMLLAVIQLHESLPEIVADIKSMGLDGIVRYPTGDTLHKELVAMPPAAKKVKAWSPWEAMKVFPLVLETPTCPIPLRDTGLVFSVSQEPRKEIMDWNISCCMGGAAGTDVSPEECRLLYYDRKKNGNMDEANSIMNRIAKMVLVEIEYTKRRRAAASQPSSSRALGNSVGSRLGEEILKEVKNIGKRESERPKFLSGLAFDGILTGWTDYLTANFDWDGYGATALVGMQFGGEELPGPKVLMAWNVSSYGSRTEQIIVGADVSQEECRLLYYSMKKNGKVEQAKSIMNKVTAVMYRGYEEYRLKLERKKFAENIDTTTSNLGNDVWKEIMCLFKSKTAAKKARAGKFFDGEIPSPVFFKTSNSYLHTLFDWDENPVPLIVKPVVYDKFVPPLILPVKHFTLVKSLVEIPNEKFDWNISSHVDTIRGADVSPEECRFLFQSLKKSGRQEEAISTMEKIKLMMANVVYMCRAYAGHGFGEEGLESELGNLLSKEIQRVFKSEMDKTKSFFSNVRHDGSALLCGIPNETDKDKKYFWDQYTHSLVPREYPGPNDIFKVVNEGGEIDTSTEFYIHITNKRDWNLSCYGQDYQANMLYGTDVSPEESRFLYYHKRKEGKPDEAVSFMDLLFDGMSLNLHLLAEDAPSRSSSVSWGQDRVAKSELGNAMWTEIMKICKGEPAAAVTLELSKGKTSAVKKDVKGKARVVEASSEASSGASFAGASSGQAESTRVVGAVRADENKGKEGGKSEAKKALGTRDCDIDSGSTSSNGHMDATTTATAAPATPNNNCNRFDPGSTSDYGHKHVASGPGVNCHDCGLASD